jgi:hypothetical protein
MFKKNAAGPSQSSDGHKPGKPSFKQIDIYVLDTGMVHNGPLDIFRRL